DGLRARIEGLVTDAADAPIWIGQTSQFVYRKSVKGGNTYMLVDAATQEKRAAFDHDRLATAIDAAIKRPAGSQPITGTSLPLGRLAYIENGRAIEFTLAARPGETVTDTTRWRCALADYVCGRSIVRPDSALRARRQVGGGLYGTPPAADARP